MATGFGVIVMNEEGKVIDYSLPPSMPHTLLKEAVSLGYDVYRMVKSIAKELGYRVPKNMTIKLDEYEVTVFSRYNRIVMAIIYEEKIYEKITKPREAVIES